MTNNTESHYEDDLIKLNIDSDFCLWVFHNVDAKTKAISFADNMFSPRELVDAYKSMWGDDWNMDEDKPEYVQKFKDWLISNGTNPEELED